MVRYQNQPDLPTNASFDSHSTNHDGPTIGIPMEKHPKNFAVRQQFIGGDRTLFESRGCAATNTLQRLLSLTTKPPTFYSVYKSIILY